MSAVLASCACRGVLDVHEGTVAIYAAEDRADQAELYLDPKALSLPVKTHPSSAGVMAWAVGP